MKLPRAHPTRKDGLRVSRLGLDRLLCLARQGMGLTLLEMMVAVTLLALIMIGLLAMFNQTQKALRVVNSQTDVFENGRGAMQMICRDLAEMTSFPDTNLSSGYAITSFSPIPGGSLPLLTTNLPVVFADAFWLTRVNTDWQGFGYFVFDDPEQRTNNGVGTLYRFSTNRSDRLGVSAEQIQDVTTMFPKALPTASNVVQRVADGIVHFSLQAIYPTNTGTATNPSINYLREADFSFPKIHEGNVVVGLPAFVDVELGVLEPETLKQYQSLKGFDPASAKSFLTNHANKIHFLRERVPIRNFVNPYRAHELP